MRLCSIASGSSGNCIYIGSDKHHILLDAGISGKKVEEGLNQLDLSTKEMDGIFITHEHSDHIKGLGVLARRYEIPIYGTKGTIAAIKGMSGIGNIDDGLFHEIQADEKFQIGDLDIHPFSISHDAAEPVAYRVQCEEKSMAVATDLGIFTDYTIDKLQGLDVLLLEANHDIHMLQVGSYPYYLKRRVAGDKGHLSNESAGQLLGKILHENMKSIQLGHLSKENNYSKLAYETVKLELTLSKCGYPVEDLPLEVAKRECVSTCISI